ISVLKDRVNPTGVLDISMEPVGRNRIEVIMPLPSDEVKALQESYKDSLATLLSKAAIPEAQLIGSLQAGSAVSDWGGAEGTGRFTVISRLQDAHNELIEARQEADQAAADGSEVLPFRVARAIQEYDRLLDLAKRQSLPESRLTRALNLSTDRQVLVDEAGEPIKDEATGKDAFGPSPREVAMDAIRADFDYVSAELDDVIAKYDVYQDKRTGFDDPEDLMRLLRGAGVLEFRIAVTQANNTGIDVNDLRDQLSKVGPTNTDSPNASWFPINDVKQWAEEPADFKLLQDNPELFFQSQYRLIAAEYEGLPYVLLYTSDDMSMTHDRGKQWSVSGTRPTTDQLGRPAVGFDLDPAGGGLMSRMTGANVGEPMAIVLDGQVYTAPNLNSQIGQSGIIQGQFSQAELDYLTRVLASGALEARLSPEPIAMNTLGPSIGADNLSRGMISFVIAVIAVCIFMLVYYFFAGFVANIALIVNGVIIFGFMAAISGTFTLPGLAGIVLTIGMAVDANVLIYERIREEIMAGELDIRGCIREGYGKALSTILDANVTNLIVCAALAGTATTEVRGFAVTLSIGIAATLFTALFVTRQVYYLYTDLLGRTSLPMLPTVIPSIHRALEPNINWIGMRRVFWAFSAVAMTGSVILLSYRGLDMFDTEFRGGVSITMRTKVVNPDDEAQGRIMLAQATVEEKIKAEAAEIANDANSSADDKVIAAEIERSSVLTVGSTASNEAGQLTCDQYQIKVATPKGLGEDDDITPVVRRVLENAFGEQLDITRQLAFDGLNDEFHDLYSYPIESPVLGDSIEMPDKRFSVAEYLYGTAIVVTNVEPAVSVDDVKARLERMRNQPDFADTLGRTTDVIPLSEGTNATGYTDFAVLVYDPAMNYRDQDNPDVVDARLAQREWELVQRALAEGSTFDRVSSYSSSVARSLAASAIVAVTLTLLGILVYIWVRFGSLRYSVAAIVALVHDVTIALGLVALTSVIGGTALGSTLLIEEFRIDLGVVAAMLTIIGYSLNDTIVILDRIRENRGKLPVPTQAIVNRSINQTVSRTLLTSVTTLVAVLIMFIEGGTGIRPFTFCLLIGLLVGTYSSVAIASPLVVARKGEGDATDEESASGDAVKQTGAVVA
ncbi:MAG: protein translocase subunit SecD, partial [Planctomycetota bacterium]